MKKILLFILLSSFAFSGTEPTLIDTCLVTATIETGKIFVAQMTATDYVVAYDSSGYQVCLQTFTLDGSYNITDNGDSWRVSNGGAETNPYMIKLADGKFMVTWTSTSNTLVRTLSATKSGGYTWTEIDLGTVLAYDSSYPALAHLTGNYYVGVQRNAVTTQSRVFTFSVDGAYDNITYIDNLIHDTNDGKTPDIEVIDATHFIVTYADDGDDGYVSTFSVDATADNITEIDEFEFDNTKGTWAEIDLGADDSHYVISYQNTSDHLVVETIELDGSYNITPIDSGVVITSSGNYSSMVKLTDNSGNNLYAANGRDASNVQKIASFIIANDGTITSHSDSLRHHNAATYNEMCRIDDNHVMVVHTITANTGYIVKTFEFDALPSEGYGHTVSGVSTPTKVNGVEAPTKVNGVE